MKFWSLLGFCVCLLVYVECEVTANNDNELHRVRPASFLQQARLQSKQNTKAVLFLFTIPIDAKGCDFCKVYERGLYGAYQQLVESLYVGKIVVDSPAIYDVEPNQVGKIKLTPEVSDGLTPSTRKLLNEHKITQLPTVVFVRDGIVREYQGQPTARNIQQFVQKTIKASVIHPITTKAKKNEILRDDSVRVLGYFSIHSTKKGKTQASDPILLKKYGAFVTAARIFGSEDIYFGEIRDQILARSLNLYDGDIVMLKTGESNIYLHPREKVKPVKRLKGQKPKKTVILPSPLYTSQDLISFIDTHKTVLLQSLKPETLFTTFSKGGNFLAYFYQGDRNSNTVKESMAFLRRVAAHYSQTISPPCAEDLCSASSEGNNQEPVKFLSIDADENTELVKKYKLHKLPAAIFLNIDVSAGMGGKESFFDPEKELNEKTLRHFIDRALSGDYSSKRVRSAPIPDENKGPIITVVRNSFKEIVEEGDKDVFIKFYTPQCKHCRTLAPIWLLIAATMKRNSTFDNIVMAEYDVSENDLPPDLTLVGVPTTIYYSHKNNQLTSTQFKGPRLREEIEKFIEEQMQK